VERDSGSSHYAVPRVAPVWSPDSTQLLLNQLADWNTWRMDVHLLDLSEGKLTPVSKNGVPVSGWATLASVPLQ
jgi:hypothetical protein